MQRRQFLLGFAAFGLGASAFALRGGGAAHAETFPFTLSDADWKSRLTSTSTRCCARRRPSGPIRARSTT